jgi:hypothetical protein
MDIDINEKKIIRSMGSYFKVKRNFKVEGAKTNIYKCFTIVLYYLEPFPMVQECPGLRSDGLRCHQWRHLIVASTTSR